VAIVIDGETVNVAKLVDEGRSGKSVLGLLGKRGTPGPEPEKRELARSALVEMLIAAGTEGVNANETKTSIADAIGVSQQTVWRAFTELREDELATGTPIRDEYGSIEEWRWSAKTALLLGRGDA
jgi:DNA invertase Pin-like site-specific DNA recombinase